MPLVAVGVMLLLLFSTVLVGAALGIGFFVAIAPLLKSAAFDCIGATAFPAIISFILVAVPLFIFMAELIVISGLSGRLYSAVTDVILGIVPGGLLQVNIATSTIFAALCGSSTASAAAVGRLAFHEVSIKRKYDKTITVGTLTAGGTLGILIPPSIPLIVYGSFAEISISDLFLAGVIPGLILASFFSALVLVRVKLNPSLVGELTGTPTLRSRLQGLLALLPFGVLVLLVLGSIYGGVATPTEASGIGSLGAIILMLIFRVFSWKALISSATTAAKITSIIFFIFIGAALITKVISYYHIPYMLASWSEGAAFLPLVLMICCVYLVLGCLLDGLSLLLVTLPFVLPIAQGAGFDLFWLGILLTIMVEIGMLTPPVGLNLYVIQAVTKESFGTIVLGSAPFVLCQIVVAALVIAYPGIVALLY